MNFIKSCLLAVVISLLLAVQSFAAAQMPFVFGETITYDIKKMNITVGKATFVYKGEAKINGAKAHLIVFTARALNFFDEELIYFDPQTYYPLVIKRTLNLWGRKESIVETYDAKKGIVTIVKDVNGKVETLVIEKPGRLDNIYCFIYRYRHLGDFKQSSFLSLNLPTKDVELVLFDQREIKIGKQARQSFYMQSEPKQYRIWFETDQSRIPLRIDGAVGFGKTSLVLKRYQPRGQHKRIPSL